MCCVMPPNSPATTSVSRMASSSFVLPWSTWPMTVTTGGRVTSCASSTSSPGSSAWSSSSIPRISGTSPSSSVTMATASSVSDVVAVTISPAMNRIFTMSAGDWPSLSAMVCGVAPRTSCRTLEGARGSTGRRGPRSRPRAPVGGASLAGPVDGAVVAGTRTWRGGRGGRTSGAARGSRSRGGCDGGRAAGPGRHAGPPRAPLSPPARARRPASASARASASACAGRAAARAPRAASPPRWPCRRTRAAWAPDPRARSRTRTCPTHPSAPGQRADPCC